ncbi:hypothetical protein AD954_13695 [Acetobacter cerevisiae]|uniref:Uncharacterized protein n=1 Tax=Acetobacter cerevisiae TaxID=178900 RepID=A0A149V724_9PROT|nr:hypothetical protein AD954_13695 [Acetobacter cerevisiae]
MTEPAQSFSALSPSTADHSVIFRKKIDKTADMLSFGQHRAIKPLKIAYDVCGNGLWHGARQSLSRISSGSTEPGHHAARASERAFVIRIVVLRIVAGQGWTVLILGPVVQRRHEGQGVGKRFLVLLCAMRRHGPFDLAP